MLANEIYARWSCTEAQVGGKESLTGGEGGKEGDRKPVVKYLPYRPLVGEKGPALSLI